VGDDVRFVGTLFACSGLSDQVALSHRNFMEQ
jgi:hypothetical protein